MESRSCNVESRALKKGATNGKETTYFPDDHMKSEED